MNLFALQPITGKIKMQVEPFKRFYICSYIDHLKKKKSTKTLWLLCFVSNTKFTLNEVSCC